MSHGNSEAGRRQQIRAAAVRALWICLALVGIALIYPWRSVDNPEEITAAQTLVDEMSEAHHSISDGVTDVDDYTIDDDGFTGFEAATPGGVAALGLIGPSGTNCLAMHWTAPNIAQVGRLPSGTDCAPEVIEEVPIRPNDGYVAGTGPPFDVTSLIREAETPFWFLAALIVLAWVVIKASLDLYLIVVRPDYFFAKDR